MSGPIAWMITGAMVVLAIELGGIVILAGMLWRAIAREFGGETPPSSGGGKGA